MYSNLLIYAPNINRGGGKHLLDEIIENTIFSECLFIIDSRNNLDLKGIVNSQVITIRPKLFDRLVSEYTLWKASKKYSNILMFGNLPPLFNINKRVVIFLQNRHVLEIEYLTHKSLRDNIKQFIEMQWFKLFTRKKYEIIVQSETMKNLLLKKIGSGNIITIIAFETKRFLIKGLRGKKFGASKKFIYLASGDLHKNHINLIEAWKILSKSGINLSLTLTIDEKLYPVISNYIKSEINEHDLNIKNVGNLNSDQISFIFEESDVLIYPSLMESLGLPLLEAKYFGLEILGSELDYIRDLVEPSQTFDPRSPKSIARAVERCIGKENTRTDIKSSQYFMDYVSAKN